ncbi:hypothetical protein Tco_0562331 [Tanacetum coccineum]
MEDEEVAMVDGVFEGAFGALGDKTCLLEALKMEALVDVMEIRGVEMGLSWHEKQPSSSSSSPWSESDILAFDGAVQLDTVQMKKSTNIVRSRKIGMKGPHSLGICKRMQCPHSFVKKAWPLYGILRI